MTTRPIVVLIGPPAAGKSRIGKKIARYLQHDFIDTDSVIVAENGPIADMFRTSGEAAFRRIERAVVARALATDAVVSLGGGAVLDDETRQQLRAHRVALLTVSAAAVEQRINQQNRPLLAENALVAWQQLVDSRRQVYESLATRAWDTSMRPITIIAREIAEWATKDMAGTTNR